MRYSILFIPALLLFAACGTSGKNKSLQGDSLSPKDSLKKAMREDLPPPSDIKQFNWFYSGFAHAVTTGNDSVFDILIHPQHGLWIIHSDGAMPVFTNVKAIGEYRDRNGKMIIPVDAASMMIAPVEEALPVVDCNSKNFYSKKGCFTQMQNTFREEKIWKYAGLTADKDKEIDELAATITRTVINTENYRYYFSLIDGTWYLTFIDIRKPCNA